MSIPPGSAPSPRPQRARRLIESHRCAGRYPRRCGRALARSGRLLTCLDNLGSIRPRRRRRRCEHVHLREGESSRSRGGSRRMTTWIDLPGDHAVDARTFWKLSSRSRSRFALILHVARALRASRRPSAEVRLVDFASTPCRSCHQVRWSVVGPARGPPGTCQRSLVLGSSSRRLICC